jgi:ketosteroid isomerase-like protein
VRLPKTAQTSRPWRINELADDFRLEDVWALPTPGTHDDFPRLVELIASFDTSRSSSRAVRVLFALRWKLGELFGWDDREADHGPQRPTLRDRLPADLRDSASGADFDPAPFTTLYLTGDEWAAEITNRTVHGILHVGWVADEGDRYRGQMAIYVKPNGSLGAVYMAAIRPFRHLIVYPRMLREIGREWRARSGGAAGRSVRAAGVVERFYAVQRRFYSGADVAEELTALLTPDVCWHVPGRSAIAGDHHGHEEVLAYFAKRREISDSSFQVSGGWVLEDGETVVHFADGEAMIGGHRRRWQTVGIFRIDAGRIAECRLLPFDQYEFDEIWSRS